MRNIGLILCIVAVVTLTVAGQTNFVTIPYGASHSGAMNWWGVAPESYPDYVTNWMAWQAVNENFRRASNALFYFQVRSQIIQSNSWGILMLVTNTMTNGDNFYTSSNGVPYVVWKDQAGSLYITRLVP